ncbi:hypothetical protein CTAYLR_010211 [Chrysophaeum taylorii]|uniref:Nicotinate-nucleotide pyrophosphorylase [carboxylating] n=1 Tax=Chrysophaeum taylorii TaxID=2483200 RepID=A0AAD7U8D0_9STRA|nr:hypothetical protein CTAYLR_010211 [Chrysophaeum taylorii]
MEAALPPHWKSEVAKWVADDAPSLDVGGFVVGDGPTTATLFAKSEGVLAGVPFFNWVFEGLGCEVTWTVQEGEWLPGGGKRAIGTVRGPARRVLLGERTALNALSRASGVATESRRCVEKARKRGWHGAVAGTRKTTPGFRIVEKYALMVGGAATHRLDLSQMVMLKDNHVWAAGSIKGACEAAKKAAGFSAKLEVECRDLAEAMEACEAGADVVMLDNYETPEALKEDAAALKREYPHVLVEASGGITFATMDAYFAATSHASPRARCPGRPASTFQPKKTTTTAW